MKNPCELCIIKVNCTEVCNEKRNYGTLIENGLEHHEDLLFKRKVRNSYYNKKYRQLVSLSHEHNVNILTINGRKMEALM